jgi:UDP-N-acetylglucosamine acyltransferase
MPLVHPTAIVDPKAELDEGVRVGPYAVIEAGVKVGAGTHIGPHVVISGPTVIGENNCFYPFGSIGAAPQDKKYQGEPTRLVIGNNNTFRENVTLNRGTVQDRGETTIGDDNWIMAGVHIAHDCVVGNHTIFANASALAGHVHVGDWAILGGYTLVHQFCRIGAHSFCGMGSVINQDVPDFVVVSGNLAEPRGINTEGLKRRGFTREQLTIIKKAYRALYRAGNRLEQAIEEIELINDDQGTLDSLLEFLRVSKRGIVR